MRWFDIAEELLPPVYRAVKDVYEYAKSLNDEFLDYLSYSERILNNFFIQRCDLSTLEQCEELLGIALHGTETLEERREKVLNNLNNVNPTSEPYVRSLIERMFPGDNYTLHFDVEHDKPFDLDIDIFTEDDDSLSEFRSWFNKMCPAHINHLVSKAYETEFDRDTVASYGNLCAMDTSLGLVEVREEIISYEGFNMSNNTSTVIKYKPMSDLYQNEYVSGGAWVTKEEFYSQAQVSIKKATYTKYYGNESVTVFEDEY